MIQRVRQACSRPSGAATDVGQGAGRAFAWLPSLLCAGLSMAGACASVAVHAEDPASAEFARVGDEVVTVQEYAAALQRGVRSRYYHGKVPEGEMARFQREVGEQLVTRALLLQEARRQQLEPDHAWVRARLDGYERRYGDSQRWQSERERWLPELTRALETESILGFLQAQVRDVPPPTEAQLRTYFDEHRDTFTEPGRFRVSLIMLKVDPSAPKTAWEAARSEAKTLLAELEAGADFTELARLRSGDASAAKGGDMGYLHRGMLGDAAEQAIDALAPGQLSAPLTLLNGVAIFRLEERLEPRPVRFEEARERVRELWRREQSERAWQAYIVALRAATPIEVREEHYLPLPPEGEDTQGAASKPAAQ